MEYFGQKNTYKAKGKTVEFDSLLEAGLAGWLDQWDYKWSRPTGYSTHGAAWTPDFQIAVTYRGHPRYAFVEVKPTLDHFPNALKRRILMVKKAHNMPVVLVYIGNEKQWYHLSGVTRRLRAIEEPTPADGPVKLQPVRRKIDYERKEPTISVNVFANAAVNFLQAALLAPFVHPSRQGKPGRRKKKYNRKR